MNLAYNLFYSRHEENGTNGVAIMIIKLIKNKILKVEYIDDQLMIMIRLQGIKKDLVLIQVYMPTSLHID